MPEIWLMINKRQIQGRSDEEAIFRDKVDDTMLFGATGKSFGPRQDQQGPPRVRIISSNSHE